MNTGYLKRIACLGSAMAISGMASAIDIFVVEDPLADGADSPLYPRFGLEDGGITDVGGDAANGQARQITGDPVRSFSDLYSRQTLSLQGLGPNGEDMEPGDAIVLSYEIWIPERGDTAGPDPFGLTSSRAELRFFADTGEPGPQFPSSPGEQTDFTRRTNIAGPLADLGDGARGQWQTVTIRDFVPAKERREQGSDEPGEGDITHFQFAILSPQLGEDPDPANSLISPASFWIRNFNLEFFKSPPREADVFFASFDGSGVDPNSNVALNPRFGLAYGDVVENSILDDQGDEQLVRSQEIIGDSTAAFSDLFSSPVTRFSIGELDRDGVGPGTNYSLTYQILLPEGDLPGDRPDDPALEGNQQIARGISSSSAFISFYGGLPNDQGVSQRRVLRFSPVSQVDLNLRGVFQTVTLNGTIPETDRPLDASNNPIPEGDESTPVAVEGNPIDSFQFGIQLQQRPEAFEGGGTSPINDFEAPVGVQIRDIKLSFDRVEPVEPTRVDQVGPVEPTRPVIRAFSFTPNEVAEGEKQTFTVALIFDSIPGDFYFVSFTNDLEGGSFIDFTPDLIEAVGETTLITFSNFDPSLEGVDELPVDGEGYFLVEKL